jgi:hypothetical protein
MRVAVFVGLMALVARPAEAESFHAHYAPPVGQHSQVRISKCQDTTASGHAPQHVCVTSTYDEEIVARAGDGYRIRYVATGVDGPGGAAALAQLQAIPLDLVTDASGAPLRLQDRVAFFQNLRQAMAHDGPSGAATIHMFEQMDDQSAANVFAREFSTLSRFQDLVPVNVGEVQVFHSSSPFPLAPSQMLDATVTFQVDSVDQAHGAANAHFDTTYTPESMAGAIQALMASVTQQGRTPPRDFQVHLSGHLEGVIDAATGAATHTRAVQTIDMVSDGQTTQRVETVSVDRQPAAPN